MNSEYTEVVHLHHARNGYNICEKRVIAKQGFVEHMREYFGDVGSVYVNAPIQQKDVIAMSSGIFIAAMSVALEGPDQLWSGIVGQEYQAPQGIAGRMRRDTGLLFEDVVAVHPFQAAGDVVRLATADWMLDGADLVGGHRQSGVSAKTTTAA